MKIDIVTGNILDQKTEVIVNSWNRNVIPWWLLLPQGVSGAIKKQGGITPFREVAKCGTIPLGEARLTSAGRLPFQGIIHVAGINLLWFATEYSVTNSVINAMKVVNENQFQSVAFPLIGSGSGNRGKAWSLNVMRNAFEKIENQAHVVIVKYRVSNDSIGH
ncbi:macro domain-containing protein [uncultured Gimesia sp.]|uniref:macro domain-containing protein n=1 Tax=uncultured Gimesia sp. TaxID=1678688 RepID=UPI0030DA6478|tara:strand:- start:100864 stop:101349 length:486 start_codon:yes stop_codon:yes gene_type:complete